MPQVAIVIGSTSDESYLEDARALLTEFGVEHEFQVISAHRKPDATREFATTARDRGIEVIIAAAGMAAHLPGVVASMTTLPGDRGAAAGQRTARPRLALRHRADAGRGAGRVYGCREPRCP